MSSQSASNRDLYCVCNTVAFLGMISQLADGRLITLDHFHYEKGRILFLVEQTLTLMDLLSLHTMLLSKIPLLNL